MCIVFVTPMKIFLRIVMLTIVMIKEHLKLQVEHFICDCCAASTSMLKVKTIVTILMKKMSIEQGIS